MNPKYQKIINACKDDVVLFTRTVSPGTAQAASPQFHYELGELWHEGHRKVCIQAPRGHAKSSLVALGMVLHHLCYDEGNKLIVLVSKTLKHSKKLLQTIKDVLNYSNEFRELFGYHGMHSWKHDTQEEIELTWERNGEIEKILITTRGTGQPIVGMKYINQRPTLAILDDPEDANNTKTMETMDANFAILQQAIVPGLDPQRGRVWVIGTPQRSNCMVERLMEMPNWVARKYQAIVDWEKKELLWGNWITWEYLMEEKEDLESQGKLSLWYSEYQCEIVGDEDQLFRPEDFRWYNGELVTNGVGQSYLHITRTGETPEGLKENPQVIPVNVFTGIDLASSTLSTADYSVTLDIAYDIKRNVYVLPYYRKRVRPSIHANQIMQNFKSKRSLRTQIESVAYQEFMRDYLRTTMNEKNDYIPGLEEKYNPRTSKSERLATLEPMLINHKLWLQPGMTELFDEMILYPRAKHDDIIDGLYYATRKLIRPDHEAKKTIEYREKKIDDWYLA